MMDYDANRKLWEERLATFEVSGAETLKGWCIENKISEPGLRYWKRKIKNEKLESVKPAFLSMEIRKEDVNNNCSTNLAHVASIRIGSFTIDISKAFDEVALLKLLKIVKSC